MHNASPKMRESAMTDDRPRTGESAPWNEREQDGRHRATWHAPTATRAPNSLGVKITKVLRGALYMTADGIFAGSLRRPPAPSATS